MPVHQSIVPLPYTSLTNQIATPTAHMQQNQTYQACLGLKCSHVTSSTNQIAASGHVTSSPLQPNQIAPPLRMRKQNQKCPNAQLDESLQYGGLNVGHVTSSTNQIAAFGHVHHHPSTNQIALHHCGALQPEPEVVQCARPDESLWYGRSNVVM